MFLEFAELLAKTIHGTGLIEYHRFKYRLYILTQSGAQTETEVKTI